MTKHLIARLLEAAQSEYGTSYTSDELLQIAEDFEQFRNQHRSTAVTNGSEILTEAHELVNGPRQATYSHPFDDYYKVKELFHLMTGHQLTVHDAVTFMICVKLARMATNGQRGDWHRDSVVDAAGYLACLSMVHEHLEDMRNDAITRFKDK